MSDQTGAPEVGDNSAQTQPHGGHGHHRQEFSEAFMAAVVDALEARDVAALRVLLADLHEADVGDLIEALEPSARIELIVLLGEDFDFAALTEMDETIRVQILADLPTELVVAGVARLESDDAVYILEDLDHADRAEILDRLPPPDRVALVRALDFPEESAGRRMQTDFIAVPSFWTVGQTIDYLPDTVELPEKFYEIFVLGPTYKLVGAVPLDTLLRTRRPVKVSSILRPDFKSVRAEEDQEEVAHLFQRYNLLTAPVVDDHERLIGVLTIDDVVDVIREEADEDFRALGGVSSDEELSDTVFYTARTRLPWLVINMATAFAAVSVIAYFEATIEAIVALAVLMPVTVALGGNAGMQALTIAVRAIATKDLPRARIPRAIMREGLVGLFNGSLLALLAGVVVGFLFSDLTLGVVLGASMVLTVLFACLFGILVPLVLDRCGIDPAVASGVFVTTTTDIVGFFTFLGLATVAFGLW